MPNRNTITLRPTGLIIQPRGLDKLWGLRRSIFVPYEVIIASSVEAGPPSLGFTTRLGLDLGAKRSGTFFTNSKKIFLNTSGKGRVLHLTLDPSFEFTDIYLSIDNPEDWARKIAAQSPSSSGNPPTNLS